MNFLNLHELLRAEIVRRIDTGTLTGTRLARQTGFRQAHISNFLNRKRGLSLEGLDRVMAALNLSVDQIIPLELDAAAMPGMFNECIEQVPVVGATAAIEDARISASSVIEVVHVAASRLHEHRSRPSSQRAHWQRFLGIRVDTQQAAAMDPLLAPGAVVVIDRHYNSLAPYRAQQRTLYAVQCGAALLLRYIDFDDGMLILRPYSLSYPAKLISLRTNETPADLLIGRVCLVMTEY